MIFKQNVFYLFLVVFIGFILYKLYNYYSKSSKIKKECTIIVSITTSPRRIKLMKNTLDSILNQTHPPDLIRINIPKQFKRTGQYYDIPKFIKNILCF